jgi:hypothetical protein
MLALSPDKSGLRLALSIRQPFAELIHLAERIKAEG